MTAVSRAGILATLLVALSGSPAVAVEASPVPSPRVALASPLAAMPSQAAASASPADGLGSVALVPVVGYWSAERSISLAAIREAVRGASKRYSRVLVADGYRDALWAALGLEREEGTADAVADGVAVSASPRRIARAVTDRRRTLGIMPIEAVSPAVRALGIGDRSLFGVDRVRALADWPLTIPAADDGAAGTDLGDLWTLAAGGDVNLDRDVYRQAVRLRKGPDFPWDGGVARITSRRCCNEFGGPEITARRAGQAGAVRRLFEGADIAIINHEGPAPDDFRWNPHGLRFSFDPALEVGLKRAGIDVVSLANNHIRDAGSDGVTESIENVRAVGIETVGAGRDAKAARAPVCLDRAGQHVCFLAYNDVDPADDATASRPGAAGLRVAQVRHDIERARRDGADVVVVVPHWGLEYTPSRTRDQRRKAAAMAKAGATVILGAHSHVAGAMERIGDVPVLYSMGNLIFDLTRFEQTLEGVIVELTFAGPRLLQVELHPTVLIDLAQPNLLDPRRDGRVVLKRMQRASKGLYP